MKQIKTGSSAHIKPAHSDGQLEYDKIFHAIRSLLVPYQELLKCAIDEPRHFVLLTNKEVAIQHKRKSSLQFATIIVNKDHVGFYFLPLLFKPTLITGLPDTFIKLKTGNTTFRIKKVVPEHLIAINELLERGWIFYINQR